MKQKNRPPLEVLIRSSYSSPTLTCSCPPTLTNYYKPLLYPYYSSSTLICSSLPPILLVTTSHSFILTTALLPCQTITPFPFPTPAPNLSYIYYPGFWGRAP